MLDHLQKQQTPYNSAQKLRNQARSCDLTFHFHRTETLRFSGTVNKLLDVLHLIYILRIWNISIPWNTEAGPSQTQRIYDMF